MTTSPPSDARLDLIVERFVASVARAEGNERARLIDDIDRMGAREIHATAAISQRLAARRLSYGKVSLERALADVRAGVLAGDIGGGSRFLRRAQRKATDAVAALNDAADAVARNTAEIAADHKALSSQVAPLREYALLAARLDAALSATSAPDDVISAARRRRGELETHLTIVLQGASALTMLELTNQELLVALRTASTAAMTALRSSSSAGEAEGALDLVDRSEVRRIAALQKALDELRAAASAPDPEPGGALQL